MGIINPSRNILDPLSVPAWTHYRGPADVEDVEGYITWRLRLQECKKYQYLRRTKDIEYRFAQDRKWITDPSAFGLRALDYNSEYTDIGSKPPSWYLSNDGYASELATGVVFRLPSRRDAIQYVSAVEVDEGETTYLMDWRITDDQRTAQRRADRAAEQYAEECREYETEDRAAERIIELREELAEARQAVRDVILKHRATVLPYDEVLPHIQDYLTFKAEQLDAITTVVDEPWRVWE